MEPQYASFEAYLEMPRAVKERKRVTKPNRYREDIENVLAYIKQAEQKGDIRNNAPLSTLRLSFSAP